MKKYINKITAFALIVCLGFTACQDLEVTNFNNPDTARALANPSDLIGLVDGGMVNLMWTTLTFRNVNFDLQADLITSTNAANNYWGDADEPRRRIDNTTTFSDKANNEYMWSGCNAAVTSANDIIRFVEGDGGDLGGVELTQKTLAAAYMMKGIAQGYISYIYDKGYVVDFDTDLTTLEFRSYAEMRDVAVANLQSAIAIYTANPTVTFDYITDSSLSAADAIQLASSYAARFIAGNARTSAERASTDWAAVKTFATNGLTSDWNPTSDENIIYNGIHSWNTFVVDGQGAGYLPVDLHVTNLADPTYPKSYPTASGVFLGPVTTSDARFGEFSDGTAHDFEYTPSIGLLREDRNRSIFANYTGNFRYGYNYATTNTGNPMHIFTAYENQLLLAEAERHLGNNAVAKTILDSGERVTRGQLPILADDTDATIDAAIYYENIIGLHSSGAGIGLAYMRRYDRLQEGSYLHLPVPASELEITGLDLYTFGGDGRGSEDGTATGANSWKN